MNHGSRASLLVVAFTMWSLLTGCAPSLIPNSSVQDTPENREIMQVVERYRRAMEQRDFDTLKALASPRYFENGSTTGDASDDWGFPDLESVLQQAKGSVKVATYDIKVTNIHIEGTQADVDYEYTWNFQYTDGAQDGWTRKTDVNRLSLLRDGGAWKITAGM